MFKEVPGRETEEGANAEAPTITEARTESFILTVCIRKKKNVM